MNYQQCQLQKGNEVVKAWIPERGAKLNAEVEIPELGGFWTVKEVYDFHATKEQIQTMNERIHKGVFDSIRPLKS